MLDKDNRFIIKNYGKKKGFASLLPSISGLFGIPIWCFYVNKGQCIASFGTSDKDHSIMEYTPCNQAYARVKKQGFRSFLKVDGKYSECFSYEERPHIMYVGLNELEIKEENIDKGYSISVNYFSLPEEKVGALVRKVTLKNISDKTIHIEMVDGMPVIIPYGMNMTYMKEMSQTAMAWLITEKIDGINSYFRVSTSIKDSTHISIIEEGNFSMCFLQDGTRVNSITDPSVVFDYDLSFDRPVTFINEGLEGIYEKDQAVKNIYPCSFYGIRKNLDIGEELTFYQVYGKADNKKILEDFLKEKHDSIYFENKRKKAVKLTDDICSVVKTTTASKMFDEYIKHNFLDNVIRGGYPIKISENKVYYVYSRKHGDLERDYHYFITSPEFYSQGNGNYRDINQNRRCDLVFAPYVASKNLHTFFGFIQLDGYNPLWIEPVKFRLKHDYIKKAVAILNWDKKEVEKRLCNLFSIGELVMYLMDDYNDKKLVRDKLSKIVDLCNEYENANFGEGYWCDHFTYNLELIENFVYIYPDKEKELLFDDEKYSYYNSNATLNKREDRYLKIHNRIEQHNAIKIEDTTNDMFVRKNYGQGNILYSTLMEKLILLSVVKYATIDPYGCGIEMEAGKPGWNDALNGLPAMFGSSMSETCELIRIVDYVIDRLKYYRVDVKLLIKLKNFMFKLYDITKDYLSKKDDFMITWNAIKYEKELYIESIKKGVSGDKINVSNSELIDILSAYLEVLKLGIKKAKKMGKGLMPTYFWYEVKDYRQIDEKIEVISFKQHVLPYFLEGIVKYLKLNVGDKDSVYKMVKNSDLYDKKLGMYKMNVSLENEPYEIGRCRVFTSGWLENESIGLHMEYKYFLELLKSGMYEEFGKDLKKMAVPFLDPDIYGRSTLENCSFIACSNNPNKSIHGKGFVARLSGATVEFINIWQIMMFGKEPFRYENEELLFKLQPYIPSYLIGEQKEITVTFLGKCKIQYIFDKSSECRPSKYTIKEYVLEYQNGQITTVYNEVIKGIMALDIRDGLVEKIQVHINN